MPTPPVLSSNVKRQTISGVYLHDLFFEISEAIGYTFEIADTYREDLKALVSLWTEQGFIEIYSENSDRAYGRVKDSNSAQNSSPWYIGLYHARLLATGEDDPLIVIVFETLDEDEQPTVVASLRFMLDHDDMFGAKGREKFNVETMRAIRRRIDGFIKRGNEHSQGE
ncbi:hypothetical protein [Pseudomonas helleri]|jgi:hypothetical protein|uniref:hypothetical protein n=1 Tax=Pseudomonas helleri TaxID=1608996 RepID=UPI003FD240F0